MSGVVVIAAGELGRYTSFTKSLGGLRVPDGTEVAWVTSANPAAGRNRAIRERPDATWFWFIDDDHAFRPDTLTALLSRDVPIVVPLCSRRSVPLSPVATREDTIERGKFPSLEWWDLPESGLLDIYASGAAGMLVRRPVLDAIGDPWFEIGQMDSEQLGEDLYFCRKARKAGFAVCVDLDVPIGHTGPMTVWPDRSGGAWGVGIDIGGTYVTLGTPRREEL